MSDTLKIMAEESIIVQDACNGSGVAHALARAFHELKVEAGITNTDELNRHPIIRMYIHKLVDLSGCNEDTFSADYDAVKKLKE